MKHGKQIARTVKNPTQEATIAIVGKYVHLVDSYKSLNEALIHGGIANHARVNLKFVDSENFEKNDSFDMFNMVDGILVPGGFGNRGIEGKIKGNTPCP